MNRDEAKKRADELRRELSRHDYLYYVEQKPEISDTGYDTLLTELIELEKEYPELRTPESPTEKVGSDLSNQFEKFNHRIPVLSLDKEYTDEGIVEWMRKIIADFGNRVSFTCEEKFDGASIVLYYEKGVLAHGVTRGNGIVGNDITANVKTIRAIPLLLSEPYDLIVRGEVLIEREEFRKLSQETPDLYANERNFAAGTLNRIKSIEVARIPLSFFAYDAVVPEGGMSPSTGIPGTAVEMLALLKRERFPVSGETKFIYSLDSQAEKTDFQSLPVEDVMASIASFRDRRMSLRYGIDGLVFKVSDFSVRIQMGYTGHHPRWAVAYKFEAPKSQTRVLDIQVQVGRGGRITPVAILEPVKVAGSQISRATLHNEEYIRMLDLGVGDTVSVSKRGDVIPAVEEVLEKADDEDSVPYLFPDKCPVCGSRLHREGPMHFCGNPDCPGKRLERIRYFASRQCMNIENLGDETLGLLFEMKLVSDIPDIYLFDAGALQGIEGFGPKKIALIREGIEKSRKQPFETVLFSLGIRELGKQTARLLISGGYESADKLLKAAGRNDPGLFTCIAGIGPKTAEILIREFSSPYVASLLKKLSEAGLSMAAAPLSTGAKENSQVPQLFTGTTWCITGTFETFKPREKAAGEIERRGGSVVTAVSGKTTHLLAGQFAGSKLDKAAELKIRIVSEKEFLALLDSAETAITKGEGSVSISNIAAGTEERTVNESADSDGQTVPKESEKRKIKKRKGNDSLF